MWVRANLTLLNPGSVHVDLICDARLRCHDLILEPIYFMVLFFSAISTPHFYPNHRFQAFTLFDMLYK